MYIKDYTTDRRLVNIPLQTVRRQAWSRSRFGGSEPMPLLCEPEEVMILLRRGVLHRSRTIAGGGEYCDYFITGDKE